MTLDARAPHHEVVAMMTDVLRRVLAHAGLGGGAAEQLVDQLLMAREALPAGACTLKFAAHAGELQIALSQAGRDWHTSCPLPIR